jgi:cardiolipin synthase
MRLEWRDGNSVRLLENGDAYFPRVFAAIRAAEREVLIETFILFEDKVGDELSRTLVDAAKRGVSVDLTVDGYGSPDFSSDYLEFLRAGGVRLLAFDPRPRVVGLRTNLFRRLHRKIVVVDGCIAFVGGINFSVDQLEEHGREAKQDYAVELEGPVVTDIHRAAHALLQAKPPYWKRSQRLRIPFLAHEACSERGTARVAFVRRDNARHTNDIEWQYRAAIRAARDRIVIANAYFLPGYRLLRALRDAARRGVDVCLILQGHPDLPWVTTATRSLYRYLLPAGVRILEYCQRPLHGKVAIVDDRWSTVGSSNLDPLSLWLNLEANVLIEDVEFATALSERLRALADHHCTPVDAQSLPSIGRWNLLLGVLLFHLLRHLPRLAGWLPAHVPRLAPIEAEHSSLDPRPSPYSRPTVESDK